MKPFTMSDQDRARFWSHVAVTDDANGCWLWTASTNNHGYGQISLARPAPPRIVRAHAVSFFLANGYLPAVMVLHTCNTRACVRPSHLYDGTRSQNEQDAIVAGTRKGLTAADKESIRIRHTQGMTLTEIARADGVDWNTVRRVIRQAAP